MDVGQHIVFTGILVLVRVFAVLCFLPVLPRLAALGIAGAFAVFQMSAAMVDVQLPDTIFAGALMITREVAVGVAMGVSARLLLVVFELVGPFISSCALGGFGDPGSPDAPMNGLFLLVGVAAFFMVDGHHALFVALNGSVVLVPVGGAHPPGELFDGIKGAVMGLFSAGFIVAVLLALPLYFAGIAADFVASVAGEAGAPWSRMPLRFGVVSLTLIALLGTVLQVGIASVQEGLDGISGVLTP